MGQQPQQNPQQATHAMFKPWCVWRFWIGDYGQDSGQDSGRAGTRSGTRSGMGSGAGFGTRFGTRSGTEFRTEFGTEFGRKAGRNSLCIDLNYNFVRPVLCTVLGQVLCTVLGQVLCTVLGQVLWEVLGGGAQIQWVALGRRAFSWVAPRYGGNHCLRIRK